MKTTVSSQGQIVLPAKFRRQDGIEAGQEFEVERLDRGEYRLVRRTTRPNEDVIDWLSSCPVKGYFVPIESAANEARAMIAPAVAIQLVGRHRRPVSDA